MRILSNPFRGAGLADWRIDGDPRLETDAGSVRALLAQCPVHAVTPLVDSAELARRFGAGALYLKDERVRMGLGSFKALGASYAIAAAADRAGGDPATALRGRTYICASAGNHGLSLAAGARVFGAQAVVYLSETVPEGFAARLEAKGAQVMRAGEDYEASLEAAEEAARDNGWMLLSDSTWDGYIEPARQVMAGYLVIGAEVAEQIPEPPTHIFLQAGVGGLASAMAACFRKCWGDAPRIVVVEPESAPCLLESIVAGEPVKAPGPVSTMGRLDCKEPSHLALVELARDADDFVLVSDAECAETIAILEAAGFATTPSGGAGVAALHHAGRALGVDDSARVLVIMTEVADP